MVEVTQEVRQSARDYLAEQAGHNWGLEYILDGMGDDDKTVQAFANIYQRGKLEGARLAIEAAADYVAHWAEHTWPTSTEGEARAIVRCIRALDPAKIVGEG